MDPRVSSENHQKIPMEEEDEAREEPKNGGADDPEPFGKTSLSMC
jgi:hypothetical protein